LRTGIILQASNITTVDATLARCYDERGHEYNIPSYCWSDRGPANLSPNKSSVIETKKEKLNIKNSDQPLALKVQVNPGDRNFVINANTSNSVSELKALICKESTIVSHTLSAANNPASLHYFGNNSFVNSFFPIYYRKRIKIRARNLSEKRDSA
jgi:hypothetical protein